MLPLRGINMRRHTPCPGETYKYIITIFRSHLRLRPVSRRHSRRGLVAGSTFRRTPISPYALNKNPMPGHLLELQPVMAKNLTCSPYKGQDSLFSPLMQGQYPENLLTRQHQLLTMRAYFSELQARFPSQNGNSFNPRGKSLVSKVSSV